MTNKSQARFIRRISAVPNAIETIDNEMICLIIFCLNCIRHGRNATYEPGLRIVRVGRSEFLKPHSKTDSKYCTLVPRAFFPCPENEVVSIVVTYQITSESHEIYD